MQNFVEPMAIEKRREVGRGIKSLQLALPISVLDIGIEENAL